MATVIAQKIGMTQVFGSDGQAFGATVLRIPENYIVQIKNSDKDGYEAVQIGTQTRKKANQPLKGHTKKSVADKVITKLAEIPAFENAEVGQTINLDEFKVDSMVTVIGQSKGKGFAGTVKRHSFATGPKTHGSHNYRAPGSIGAQQPQRVVKGKKMAGHMGAERITTKGLQIMSVSPTQRTIVIKGAVPGPKRSYVIITEEK